jgi:hypothetical protein
MCVVMDFYYGLVLIVTSVGIACSSPLNIFIHVIPKDGPYGPKHAVKIIRA